MRKLFIVEFKVYTDGDMSVDNNFFTNYKSHYFENDLYEYSYCEPDDYTYSLRRVFDTKNEAIMFVNALFDSMRGDSFFIKETAPRIKNEVITGLNAKGSGNDFTDGNIEMELTMRTFETSARKIKEIIYEDNEGN